MRIGTLTITRIYNKKFDLLVDCYWLETKIIGGVMAVPDPALVSFEVRVFRLIGIPHKSIVSGKKFRD